MKRIVKSIIEWFKSLFKSSSKTSNETNVVTKPNDEEQMPKVINIYGNFTASAMLAKSSNTGDRTVNGNTVEVNNISISKIKAVLNTGNNELSVLHAHSSNNQHSWYGPREWYQSSLDILNREKPSRNLSDWACYNHTAIAPHYSYAPEGIGFDGQTTTTFQIFPYIEEFNLVGIDAKFSQVKVVIRKANGVSTVMSDGGKTFAQFYANPTMIVTVPRALYDDEETVTVSCVLWNGDSDWCRIPGLSFEAQIRYQEANIITNLRFFPQGAQTSFTISSADCVNSNYNIIIDPINYNDHILTDGYFTLIPVVYNAAGDLLATLANIGQVIDDANDYPLTLTGIFAYTFAAGDYVDLTLESIQN